MVQVSKIIQTGVDDNSRENLHRETSSVNGRCLIAVWLGGVE